MPERPTTFTSEEWKTIHDNINRFWENFSNTIRKTIINHYKLQGQYLWTDKTEPPDILRVRECWNTIRSLAKRAELNPSELSALHFPDDLRPFLKSVLISVRRDTASECEQYKRHSHHPDVLARFDAHIQHLDALISQDWCIATTPEHIPQLADYFYPEQLEQLPQTEGDNLTKRTYDPKLPILYSSHIILQDLEYYRRKCSFRDVSLIVAFLDIDDFKAINTELTEPVVDRTVLPLFMRTVEAHTFFHGSAYRHGGDEVVIIIPNISREAGICFLDALRIRASSILYQGTNLKTCVSIGFAHIDRTTYLTNQEAVDKAAAAKRFAKNNGKNRIATYRSTLFRDSDWELVTP